MKKAQKTSGERRGRRRLRQDDAGGRGKGRSGSERASGQFEAKREKSKIDSVLSILSPYSEGHRPKDGEFAVARMREMFGKSRRGSPQDLTSRVPSS